MHAPLLFATSRPILYGDSAQVFVRRNWVDNVLGRVEIGGQIYKVTARRRSNGWIVTSATLTATS